MSTGRTDEVRKEAVRIALTSGLSRRQIADDLGGGFSTLNKWVHAHRGAANIAHPLIGWHLRGCGGGFLVHLHSPRGYNEPEFLHYSQRHFGHIGVDATLCPTSNDLRRNRCLRPTGFSA